MDARELLLRRRDELVAMEPTRKGWSKIEAWLARTRPLMVEHFTQHVAAFDKLAEPRWIAIPSATSFGTRGPTLRSSTEDEETRVNDQRAKERKEELIAHLDTVLELTAISASGRERDSAAAFALVEHILSRFHAISLQLRRRHGDRPTLDVKDEYDVQYLLHALLRLHFEDVRPEEYSPSYAGAPSRMDFLLIKERIVVEVKKPRHGLRDKEIGEELIVDVARYAKHPHCEKLICFIYDPDGLISNAAGLAEDLESLPTRNLDVRVLVFPS